MLLDVQQFDALNKIIERQTKDLKGFSFIDFVKNQFKFEDEKLFVEIQEHTFQLLIETLKISSEDIEKLKKNDMTISQHILEQYKTVLLLNVYSTYLTSDKPIKIKMKYPANENGRYFIVSRDYHINKALTTNDACNYIIKNSDYNLGQWITSEKLTLADFFIYINAVNVGIANKSKGGEYFFTAKSIAQSIAGKDQREIRRNQKLIDDIQISLDKIFKCFVKDIDLTEIKKIYPSLQNVKYINETRLIDAMKCTLEINGQLVYDAYKFDKIPFLYQLLDKEHLNRLFCINECFIPQITTTLDNLIIFQDVIIRVTSQQEQIINVANTYAKYFNIDFKDLSKKRQKTIINNYRLIFEYLKKLNDDVIKIKNFNITTNKKNEDIIKYA